MHGRTMAVGVFKEPGDVRDALSALKRAGFEKDEIGLAVLQAPDAEGVDLEADAHRVRVDETTGILAGGILGGVAGWLIGAAAVAVPGLGALIAAGALVGAVGGAGLGAAAGGLIGMLVEHGIGREEAEYYHEQIRLGATLVTVRNDSRADEAQAILQQHGAHDYHTRTSQEPRRTTP
jgi:hypothetical protein